MQSHARNETEARGFYSSKFAIPVTATLTDIILLLAINVIMVAKCVSS